MTNNKIYYRDKFTDFQTDFLRTDDFDERCPLYSIDTNGVLHLTIIPGVLKLSSKNFNTTSTKNYIMKEFEPIFSILPRFMVKTNKIKDTIDKYVTVKISHKIDKITKVRILIGTIDRYIGDVGDLKIEKEICHIMNTCHWSRKIDRRFSLNNVIKNQDLYSEIGISHIDLTPDRLDMTNNDNIYIVSVDPDGSKDIDDAISVELFDDNAVIVGIHIADPSSYLLETSDLDIEVSKRIESIYLNNYTQHMFPEQLATDLFSLKKHKFNRAFSVMMKLNKCDTTWIINEIIIKKTLIKINDNMSYDKFQNLINDAQYINLSHIKLLYEIGHEFYIKYLDPDERMKYTSKQMIEIFMVLANHYVADRMIKLNSDKIPIILRTQEVLNYKFDLKSQNNSNLSPEQLAEHIKLKRKSAELKFYDKQNSDKNIHSSLNLTVYTHFTSPIRRYSDVLVHRILYNLISNTDTFTLRHIRDDKTINCLDIMFRMNHYKKFYKKIAQLEKNISMTHYIIEKNGGTLPSERIIYLRGVILDVDVSMTNKKIKLTIKCQEICSEEKNNKELSEHLIDNIHTVKITQNNCSYDLFESIDYKMCFLKNDIRKVITYL